MVTKHVFSYLRFRLLLLVFLAVIPAFGVILYTAQEQRHIAAQAAKEKTILLARNASEENRRFINATRRFLNDLVQRPEIDQDMATCSAYLSTRLEEYPEYSNIVVFDLDGNTICSAQPMQGPVNVSDRLYFRETIETRDFSVGEYQVGRITGKTGVTFGYPDLDHKGRFRAVVAAVLDLEWLNSLLSRFQLPPGSVLTLLDSKGRLLARSHDAEKWVGKDLRDMPFITRVLEQNTPAVEMAGLDGVYRLYGFSPLRVSGKIKAFVVAGIPTQIAYADVDRILIRNLILLGIVTLLAALAAWFGGDVFILRSVNRLVTATKELKAGDLAARTSLHYDHGELGQLARCFDEMAETNQRRYTQLQALREIDLAIVSTLDMESVLDILLEKTEILVPYAAASVRLIDAKTGRLELVAHRNIPEGALVATVANSRTLPDLVLEYRSPLVISNIENEAQTSDREGLIREGFCSYVGVPLGGKGGILGVLSFYTKREHAFTREEVEFLATLGGQAAIAIENARLYERAKEQSRLLEKANQAKNEFLSVISHELRTPLNVIKGYTEIMRAGVLGEINTAQENALATTLRNAMELLRVINSMLQVTLIQANVVSVLTHKFNLGDFIESLRADYDCTVPDSLTLRWHYAADLPAVKTDDEKLRAILQNLIDNAIKFTEQGTVTLSASIDSDTSRIFFTVADTGIGIPKDRLPFIFDMFKQGDSSDTRRYGGVGLGLYISKRLTELLGGTIELESEPGKGSVFTVAVPVLLESKVAGPHVYYGSELFRVAAL